MISQWRLSLVSIGLPAAGYGEEVFVKAPGFTGLIARLLSDSDKAELADLSRKQAIADRDAGYRPDIGCDYLKERLQGYEHVEIQQALDIVVNSDSEFLTLNEARRVWDRVSVTLDQHSDGEPDGDLAGLWKLEEELSKAGRYGK